MSRFILTLLWCSLNIVYTIHAARILAVFPNPSISHHVVFRVLTQELVKRGHEVVVITTDPAFPKGQAPVNLTEIDVHDISYKIYKENALHTISEKKDDMYIQFHVIMNTLVKLFKQQMLTDEVQALIRNKNEHFDLLLLEACVKSTISFTHVFKAPVILVSSFGAIPYNYELVGAPTNPPLLYPRMSRQRLYNLTLWEKVTELFMHYRIVHLFSYFDEKLNTMIKEVFGPEIPTVQELSNNVDMIFFNVHPLWEGNFPVPPSVVYLGGLHETPQKDLPQDLQDYIDSSMNGVIYISFGTNVNPSLLPADKIQSMVKVLSRLPYDVLWKWDESELAGKPKNIRVSKWFPQSDLLRHPKIKLFITHGGLQSTDEAITAGVPLIGMPMMGDQWLNAEKYTFHKIGLKYQMETLTEESFRTAITTVIGDESYRRNVAKLRELMLDQPQRPLERAVWWTEHVLRHGGARHLRAPAANMSWSEYLDLELVSALLMIFIFVLGLVCIPINLFLKYVKRIRYFKLKSR